MHAIGGAVFTDILKAILLECIANALPIVLDEQGLQRTILLRLLFVVVPRSLQIVLLLGVGVCRACDKVESGTQRLVDSYTPTSMRRGVKAAPRMKYNHGQSLMHL